jgi:drug/metabolite transporter (DMT)-like permease
MLPFAWITPSLITSIEVGILQKIAVLALISRFIGMYFYYQGLKRIPAHWARLAEMFFPVAAIFINGLFLNVGMTQVQLIGAFNLVAASTMVQVRPRIQRKAEIA